MRKAMLISTPLFLFFTVSFYTFYHFSKSVVFYSRFVSFFTISYHFVMRLAVGLISRAFPENLTVPDNKWFSPKKFERKIYKFLSVKKWKGHIPAYYPEAFSVEKHSLEEISKTMCGAELTHEIIFVLSFVPIFFSLEFGVPLVFVITSFFAAEVDSVFIIVLRYNRPRILKLMKLKKD